MVSNSTTCLLCRTKMFRTVSLLATTVIENIEHSCSYEVDGCQEKFPLNLLAEHKKSCQFRSISCPAYMCNKRVVFTNLVNHLLNQCEQSKGSFARAPSSSSSATSAAEVYMQEQGREVELGSWQGGTCTRCGLSTFGHVGPCGRLCATGRSRT